MYTVLHGGEETLTQHVVKVSKVGKLVSEILREHLLQQHFSLKQQQKV